MLQNPMNFSVPGYSAKLTKRGYVYLHFLSVTDLYLEGVRYIFSPQKKQATHLYLRTHYRGVRGKNSQWYHLQTLLRVGCEPGTRTMYTPLSFCLVQGISFEHVKKEKTGVSVHVYS